MSITFGPGSGEPIGGWSPSRGHVIAREVRTTRAARQMAVAFGLPAELLLGAPGADLASRLASIERFEAAVRRSGIDGREFRAALRGCDVMRQRAVDAFRPQPPPAFPTPRLRPGEVSDAEVCRSLRSLPAHFASQRKLVYPADSALTITLASLPTSSGLTAGRESDAWDNSSNVHLDVLVSGKATTGTSPAAGRIEYWAIPEAEDTPTWPDVFDGTDSAETITSRDMLASYGELIHTIITDTTSDRTYFFKKISLASFFGFVLPRKGVIFVTHNTNVNFNSTGSNHAIWLAGVYEDLNA